MAASYKHDIAAWMDGTEGLSDGEYRAYHVVCQLIYLNNGAIVLNETGIAGRCNQHVLAFRKNLTKLVERKKLIVRADGKLSNKRAESELSNPKATPAVPQPDPPTTPKQPPDDLDDTPGGSHGGHAAKPLINQKPEKTAPKVRKPTHTQTLLSSKTQTLNKVRKKVSAKPKSKGELLPSDWKPKPSHYEKGEKLGFARDVVDGFADKMRNWSIANAHRPVARKSNWDAAFHNWLVDKSERNGGRHGAQNGDGKDRSVSAAAGRLLEAGFSFGPRPRGIVPEQGPPARRLLPQRGGE